MCGGVGMFFGMMVRGIGGAIVGAIASSGIGFAVYRVVAVGSANAMRDALMPDARGGAGVGYSHIEALEARGDVTGALKAWEEAVAASPGAIAARVSAADLHARRGNNPARAAALFREVLALSGTTPDTQRYVAQRLVDLYLGPLNDEGKALVELRKIADRWPNTPEGDGARRAILKIKNA